MYYLNFLFQLYLLPWIDGISQPSEGHIARRAPIPFTVKSQIVAVGPLRFDEQFSPRRHERTNGAASAATAWNFRNFPTNGWAVDERPCDSPNEVLSSHTGTTDYHDSQVSARLRGEPLERAGSTCALSARFQGRDSDLAARRRADRSSMAETIDSYTR